MAEIFCGVAGESQSAVAPKEPSSLNSRRRRLELVPFMFAVDRPVLSSLDEAHKRRKMDLLPPSVRHCDKAVEHGESAKLTDEDRKVKQKGTNSHIEVNVGAKVSRKVEAEPRSQEVVRPGKFGMTSICGWRRDMEDAVSLHPQLCNNSSGLSTGFDFFGVFDGHGCSHVAMKCKDRFHEIMKDEVESFRVGEVDWKATMERSFERMDREVTDLLELATSYSCRCDLQSPQCDAVGSTAVVAVVTPDKIVVSNCGDSRAVLCRNGVALALSSDHKPDRPDELVRIQSAGGRVIYWDGPRVLGVLAMSRAIGDNYLKPYVISEPEVVIMDRTADDECLILASDGLWDVVNNETACGVARMCLRSQKSSSAPVVNGAAGMSSDKACWDASVLLTKLALARRSADNISVVVVDLNRNS